LRERKVKGSTSFCEHKEEKKLYQFQCRALFAPREAEQKFFGSFLKKDFFLHFTLT
jgi:hypothetical protein